MTFVVLRSTPSSFIGEPTPQFSLLMEHDGVAERIATFHGEHAAGFAIRVAALLNRNGIEDVPLSEIEA